MTKPVLTFTKESIDNLMMVLGEVPHKYAAEIIRTLKSGVVVDEPTDSDDAVEDGAEDTGSA